MQRQTLTNPNLKKNFSSVFTNVSPEDLYVVKKHVNKLYDKLGFTMELVLKELTALDTIKSMCLDILHPRILYELWKEIALLLNSISSRLHETQEKVQVIEKVQIYLLSTKKRAKMT